MKKSPPLKLRSLCYFLCFRTAMAFVPIQQCHSCLTQRILSSKKSQHVECSEAKIDSTEKESNCVDNASRKVFMDRRKCLSTAAAAAAAAAVISSAALTPSAQAAESGITRDSEWPLWPALPVAPYSRRRTIRQEIVQGKVWTFDQLIGIYYVHVPIRMTVMAAQGNVGLVVFAPVAPTRECLQLLQELMDQHGPIRSIILPSVAVEHKVLAGPFAREFPQADFYVTDRQYSFPLSLPDRFLGLPSWTKPLPSSGSGDIDNNILGPDFSWEVITIQPGPKSMYQDVALFHKSSKTLAVCDAVFATTTEPPAILTQEPEYTRALLFHARDEKDEVVLDTPEARRKGWRRIVLLFNFFFPGAGKADLGLGPILQALQTPDNTYGWGGWKPFSWNSEASELLDFNTFSANGKPTILPILQIIMARGPKEVTAWIDTISTWDFERVIPAHLDAPLNIGPREFADTFAFVKQKGRNEVRFCDEDVTFLRRAEEGFLSFSVFETALGALRGKNGLCGL